MESKMRANTSVLIIGAGPTGLLAASQLARLGTKFRIIEKNSGPNRQSRALAIHAGSMEIFNQMGIAEQFLNLGVKVQAVNYMVKGKVQKRIPLSEFGKGLTKFPFLLVVEQSKTEKILVDFLEKKGHKVEWQTELVDFRQTDQGVLATIKHFSHQSEIVNVSWMIGADGARSAVRQKLDIPFGGETYPIDLFVLDCKVDWKLKFDEMYIAFSDHSFAGFFPMPEGRCRVIGFVPDEAKDKENVTFEDVSKGFKERMQMDIELSDPDWISMYHSHHRYVSQFKIGRCFLVGDAAHIHSPVGAQGMNTGLQDAYNLAWKLAFVINGNATTELLSTYHEERLPFARQLVKTTDNAFNVTVSDNAFVKYMRMYIAPRLLAVILKIKFLERFIFKTISQIGIKYNESKLTQKDSRGTFSNYAPKPGEKLPFIKYENVDGEWINIQRHVDGLSFRLIHFPGSSKDGGILWGITKKYSNTITYESIPLAEGTKPLYTAMGITEDSFYLVRPDLHIAYRSNSRDVKNFENYLATFLTASKV
jgi:2-polyprenyl-6-methoxyphenol hydroxylase-like FAD-dependent oxidoreductase